MSWLERLRAEWAWLHRVWTMAQLAAREGKPLRICIHCLQADRELWLRDWARSLP